MEVQSRSRGRRGVLRLNRGSTTYGRYSAFPLNSEGGTFGSGRPAGGGAGAGMTLMSALTAPALSVQGAPEVGPPPVDVSQPVTPPVAQPQAPQAPVSPTFREALIPPTPPLSPVTGLRLPRPPAPSVPPIPPRFSYY